MSKKRINICVVIAVLLLLVFVGYKYYKAQSIIRDGEVLAGGVRIADDKYIYTSFATVGRTKKIAEIDN